MIVISNETTLSIDKVAKLLQKLVDLKEHPRNELPDKIESSVKKILDAQKKFVEEIDEYMHGIDHDEDDLETVKTVGETCPEFLATMDKDGDLPIHCSVSNRSLCSTYVPLLANIGCKNGIGGKEGRGGLLVKNKVDQGYHVLKILTFCPSTGVFNALRDTSPPLFCTEDVSKYHLLHQAVINKNIEMVKYMVDLYPGSILHPDEEGNIPIYYSCTETKDKKKGKKDKAIVEFLLERSISSFESASSTVGALLVETNKDDQFKGKKLILDCLIERFGEEKAWDSIERALSRFDGLPILHRVIEYAPKYCFSVMERFPDSVFVRDERNRSPLHIALDKGMNWSPKLVSIINSNHLQLKEVDPVTKWPPFALAAMENSCDLRTIYHLLHKHPEHVELSDDDVSYKYLPVQKTKKKQKIY
jgi:hypothetical protein